MYNSGVGSGGSNAPDQFGGQRCTRARTFVVSAAARSFCEQLEIVAGEQRGPHSAGPHALVGIGESQQLPSHSDVCEWVALVVSNTMASRG